MADLNHQHKSRFDEENPFLGVIELDDTLRGQVLKDIGKEDYEGRVYLWNQLNDPLLNPNDYVKLEDASNVKIKWIFSSCQEALSLGTLDKMDAKVDEAYVDQSPEMDQLQMLNEDLDAEEQVIETIEIEQATVPLSDIGTTDTKFIQVFEVLQAKCCEHKEDCDKNHFLVGEGIYVVNGKEYPGIHVISFPDYNPDQGKLFTGYTDKIRELFEQKKTTVTENDRPKFAGMYAENLRNTL